MQWCPRLSLSLCSKTLAVAGKARILVIDNLLVRTSNINTILSSTDTTSSDFWCALLLSRTCVLTNSPASIRRSQKHMYNRDRRQRAARESRSKLQEILQLEIDKESITFCSFFWLLPDVGIYFRATLEPTLKALVRWVGGGGERTRTAN